MFHYLKERQFCRLLSSWVPGERLPNINSALSMEKREAVPSLIQHFCSPSCLPLAVLACPNSIQYPLWVKSKDLDLSYSDKSSRITSLWTFGTEGYQKHADCSSTLIPSFHQRTYYLEPWLLKGLHLRDTGLIPGSGRSPGEGHGNSLQYSCLENLHGQRNLVGYNP